MKREKKILSETAKSCIFLFRLIDTMYYNERRREKKKLKKSKEEAINIM